MKTTNERIFANDIKMSYWQQDNCMRCAKAVWYNTQLGRCPKYKCALQRDMEAQAAGDMEINERSYNACHNAKTCHFIKAKEQETAPGDEILDFSKGESMFNETARSINIEQAPEIEHGHEEKPTPASEHKIPETVKLSRAVKHVRQEYVDSLKKDLDARHIQRIEKQTEEFFKEYTSDFTIFWYCVNSQYKKQFPGDIYKDMKTDAFLGVLMCRFLVDHNKRMDKIIEAKMGFAQSIKNPYMDKLETCLDAYCGNQVIECDTNIKACLKVLEKNINEIDFEITG